MQATQLDANAAERKPEKVKKKVDDMQETSGRKTAPAERLKREFRVCRPQSQVENLLVVPHHHLSHIATPIKSVPQGHPQLSPTTTSSINLIVSIVSIQMKNTRLLHLKSLYY